MESLESSRVSHAMLTEMTTLGVDDWLFIMNIEMMLVMCMGLRIYAWVIVAFLLHFVLMVVTRQIPNLMEVYFKYWRQFDRYCATFSIAQKRGLRPLDFGKDELL